jgi:cyclase
LSKSLKRIKTLSLENIIQGHGGVLLRGEIDETIDSSMAYLRNIEKRVRAVVDKGQPKSALRRIDVESCGKSRIPLGGLVQRLHQANLDYVYDEMMAEKQADESGTADERRAAATRDEGPPRTADDEYEYEYEYE